MIAFWARARGWLTAHGIITITRRRHRQRARVPVGRVRPAVAHAARRQRTRPFTPKHNEKVERH